MKNEWEEITRAGAKGTAAAMHILRAVFRAYPGNLAVRLWTGETATFGAGAPDFRPGERFLDIGCGWGALILWAAKHFGVHAHGITLSRKQYAYASARILEEGLQDRVSVELPDYRDIEGRDTYDKIASVGMFEHVGLKNLPVYFATAHRLLRPGGLFLNHGITHEEEGWSKTPSTNFINRYMFPDGDLDTISNVQQVMERASFEILDRAGSVS